MNISRKLMLCVGLMLASHGANAISLNVEDKDIRVRIGIGTEYIFPSALLGVSLLGGIGGYVEGFGLTARGFISTKALVIAAIIGGGSYLAYKKYTKKQEPKTDDQEQIEQAPQVQ